MTTQTTAATTAAPPSTATGWPLAVRLPVCRASRTVLPCLPASDGRAADPVHRARAGPLAAAGALARPALAGLAAPLPTRTRFPRHSKHRPNGLTSSVSTHTATMAAMSRIVRGTSR